MQSTRSSLSEMPYGSDGFRLRDPSNTIARRQSVADDLREIVGAIRAAGTSSGWATSPKTSPSVRSGV